ncbi:uncharacterized protein isoform X3 [Danio rerio]|uniref:Uncharacterized protein isoform X3 n=1 Tax=Danio rerio TaxID=7955 RepID=A0AC58GSG4_DANRE
MTMLTHNEHVGAFEAMRRGDLYALQTLRVLPARKRGQSKNPSSLSGVLPICKKPRVESDPTCSGLQPAESLTSDRAALSLRCETVNSPALTASSSTIVTSQKNQSTDTSSDSSESTDSSDSEPTAKKKKKGKKSKRQKKSKTKMIDIKRVRIPEDSINRYNKVLQLVRDGLSKAEAYNKVKIDRNTIVMQVPIAELATANPPNSSL